MHFHCWELAKASNDKDHAFILRGKAEESLFAHKDCQECCDCHGKQYTIGVRRELASHSPDLIQIPLCGKCNATIEVGDFCGVTMNVGKQYTVSYNMCRPCREFMITLISSAFKREKLSQPKKEGYKRNIII